MNKNNNVSNTNSASGLRRGIKINGSLSGSIVYTEQGENHGHMILHGGSHSDYTVL